MAVAIASRGGGKQISGVVLGQKKGSVDDLHIFNAYKSIYSQVKNSQKHEFSFFSLLLQQSNGHNHSVNPDLSRQKFPD